MILRHLIGSIKKQDWGTVLVEIMIVVVGIFVGLQVDDWNQQRQEHVQEALILNRLNEDFDGLVANIEDSIRFHERVLSDLQVVLATINAGALLEHQETAFKSGLAWGYVNFSPAGRSGTFVDISSSGLTRLLRDGDLRKVLQKYDLLATSAPDAWLEIRSVMNLFIKDFTKYFIYAEQLDDTENIVGIFDLQGMLTDPNFLNAVHEIRQTQVYYLRWHRRLLDAALEVSQRLDQSNAET